MINQSRVVIIGGGIYGVSITYHLAQLGWTDLVLLEKNEISSGATAHAAGLVTQFATTQALMQIRKYSIELYSELGLFNHTGSLRVASSPEQMMELQRSVSRAKGIGMEVETIAPREVVDIFPQVSDRELYGGIYLPNTRWFEGEEATGETRESFTRQLAGLADVFVNDAFGSWQPHASTCDISKHLPAYAGFLMQEEIRHLGQVLRPQRPFVAVVAGAKYDTKIGPLNELYKRVDHLILGGVIYNTYLCAKYKIRIAGVSDEDIHAAKRLVSLDKKKKKIVELPYIVEAQTLGKKVRGKYKRIAVKDLARGQSYGLGL